MKEMLGGCCVCADENGWTDNPLIYCDGPNCEVAVHQGCYGIQEVPDGEWLCAKCSASSSTSVYSNGSTNGSHKNGRVSFRCELCPSSFGALKRTDKGGWAHVICALYIPEVRFGDVHSMEPVILSDVPNDRFDRICYICENSGERQCARMGACMSCNKNGCKRSFHVTCAQQKGLLCEEGYISKNVKYCGFCENHLRKAQNDPSIKVIPACPVTRLPQQNLPTPPPSSNNSAHMLVESLPPRPDQVNNVLRIGSTHRADTPPSRSIVVTSSSASGVNPNIFASTTTFSPPLTTSSRSSVALESTPPLVGSSSAAASVSTTTTTGSSALGGTSGSSGVLLPPPPPPPVLPPTTQNNFTNGSMTSHHLIAGASAETTVGAHLQQIQQAQSAVAAATSASNMPNDHQNGVYGVNYLSSIQNSDFRLPSNVANFLPGGSDFHLNGSNDLEEKTVKAVLTAPLTKAKRMREAKSDILEKVHHKRPRANARPTAPSSTTVSNATSTTPSASSSGGSIQSAAATVGKSASMQRLISLVAPVVSETVSDFQRDRIAERTAAGADKRVGNVPSAVTSTSSMTPSTSTTNGSNGTSGAGVTAAEVMTNAQTAANVMSIQGFNSQSINGNGRGHSSLPSSMEQLLERQWEQGSQLLMSQAHFDVAQLLTCLHQLKTENIRLEQQLDHLTKRKEHLLALNGRLSQPLGPPLNSSTTAASTSTTNHVTSPPHQTPMVPPTTTSTSAVASATGSTSTPAPTTNVPASTTVSTTNVEELNQLRSLSSGNSGNSGSTATQQISRPLATHPPAVSSAAALMTTPSSTFSTTSQNSITSTSTPNNRTTPSTAGQALAATPIMSAATSNTTTLADFANMSTERLQQLGASPILNSIYRNQMLSPALLSQLMLNPEYLSNQASLSNNVFSRILQQPQMVAAAAALVVGNSNQQGSAATSNGN